MKMITTVLGPSGEEELVLQDSGLAVVVDSSQPPPRLRAPMAVMSERTAAYYLLLKALGYSWVWSLVVLSLEVPHRQTNLRRLGSPVAIGVAVPFPLQPLALLAELQAWLPSPLLPSPQLASCASPPAS